MSVLLIARVGLVIMPLEGSFDVDGDLIDEDNTFQVVQPRNRPATPSTMNGVCWEAPMVEGDVYHFDRKIVSSNYAGVCYRAWTQYLTQLAGDDTNMVDFIRALNEPFITFGSVACRHILEMLEELQRRAANETPPYPWIDRMTQDIVSVFYFAVQDPNNCGSVQIW